MDLCRCPAGVARDGAERAAPIVLSILSIEYILYQSTGPPIRSIPNTCSRNQTRPTEGADMPYPDRNLFPFQYYASIRGGTWRYMGACTGMGVPLMPPRARKIHSFPRERQRKPCCSSGPEAPGTVYGHHGPLPNHVLVQSSFLYLLLCCCTVQYSTP